VPHREQGIPLSESLDRRRIIHGRNLETPDHESDTIGAGWFTPPLPWNGRFRSVFEQWLAGATVGLDGPVALTDYGAVIPV
jgi:hypothetical protein